MVVDIEQIKNTLDKQFMKYGYMPYLLLLHQLEKEEKYEICKIIVDIIMDKSKKYSLQLPTKLNHNSLQLFFNSFNKSKNKGAIAYQNLPYYTKELRDSINID